MLKTMLLVDFALNFMLSGAMAFMITLIRSLQMILHLAMYKILLPGNVLMVFSIIIRVVMYDILESEYTSELILSFDFEG